ncbi:MAG: phosphoglucosamine mutase, partial [Trueperaceae bacterium]
MTRTLFGTDGVRGVAGRDPMRAETAFALGRATTERLRERLERAPRLLIGMDTRRSGPMLAYAFASGAMARGAHVTWAGVIPTPGVAFLTGRLEADAGVVVSASHNPFEDNGIKIFGAGGRKLPDGEELTIEAWLSRTTEDEPGRTGDEIGTFDAHPSDDGAYAAFLLTHAPYLDGLRVGLDCANGAASRLAPARVEKIGARLQTIHDRPDGVNINRDCGSTHPDAIRAFVTKHGLDVGVTFDGDADRALLVDRRGRLVTGDHMLAIVASVRHDRELVATVMTNLGIERWLQGRGVTVHRTQVGDRYVLQELHRRGLRLGGEASGHLLFLDKAPTGDGLLTALQVLAAVRASNRSLEAWMDDIPTYPQLLRNVPVAADQRSRVAVDPDVSRAVRDAEADLGED